MRAQAETLLAACVGSFVFWSAGLPAASISGAMVGVALLLSARRSAVMHPVLRDAGMLIGGVTMGSAVTPEMIAALQRYPISLALLVLAIAATIGCTQFFLRKVGQVDRYTAFFASAPGALSSVLAVASETKADLLKVTIIQSFRLFVLVAILPSIVVATGGGGHDVVRPIASIPALLIIFGGGAVIAYGLQRAGMAAPWIFGGMLTSAVLHGSGLVVGEAPRWLGELGYGLVGVFIGTRFSTVTRAALLGSLKLSIGAFFVGLAVAVVASFAAMHLASVPFGQALVAFAPGGLEAMIIVGASLGLDPLYVGLHHLVRFFSIALLIPLALPFLRRLGPD